MYCRKCGEKIENDSLFCKFCGTEIITEKPKNLKELSENMCIDNPIHISRKKELLKEHQEQWEKYNNQNAKMKPNTTEHFQEIKPSINQKQHSMKWFNFLTGGLMPMWLFLSPFLAFGSTYANVLGYYGDWNNFFTNETVGFPNSLSIIVYFIIWISLFFAFTETHKFSTKGYLFTMIFFILSNIYPIINMLIYLPFYIKANVDYKYATTIGELIGLSLFYIPNIIYFKKRKYLFDDNNKLHC